MQYADPNVNWAEWIQGNEHDEATKLAALREYIVQTARDAQATGDISADWTNKKLAALGITEQLAYSTSYALEVPVTGTYAATVYARSRADATDKLRAALVSQFRLGTVLNATFAGDPTFLSGPEDADPGVVDLDAPTTVSGTLAVLREIILFGHIAGPKYCQEGADDILKSFGLDVIPARKRFTVTLPVEGEMKTVVEAYDWQSAQRVAGWRWDNGRTGYTVSTARATDLPGFSVPADAA